MENRPWHRQYDPGVPFDIEVPNQTLDSFLKQSALEYPQRPCTFFDGSTLSFAEVDALSDRIARLLIKLGTQIGDPIGICMPNMPQFVITYFGILKAGGVVAAINPRFGSGELRTLLSDVNPRIIFAYCIDNDLLNRMEQFITVEKIILTNMDEASQLGETLQEHLEFDYGEKQLLAFLKMEIEAELPQVTPQDDCIFQYSGGTTGTPKAAAATHRALVANTLQFRAWLHTLLPAQERTLVAIPLYHSYGMVIGMCASLSLHATIVLHDERKGLSGMLTLLEEQACTLFPAVPYLLEAILLQPEIQEKKSNLNSLKVVISGASPLRVQCQDAYEQLLKGRLVEGYGLSEAPTATHCNPVQGEVRPGTIGLPLPGVDARIVSLEDGQTPMPTGEIGELILKSPQVMRGYLNRQQETERVLRDGWLYTGDIARVDQDGYFTLVDRKKDLIKVNAFQVWPYEIESVLAHHPAIRDAGVIGIPDPLHGETVVAWLVLEKGQSVDLESVQEWCKRWLASYKTPREIHFCETLPRNALGKLLRRELRRMTTE